MNSFQLKVLACVLMVIDHVAEFLPGMPIWMHWIGRLSAPIFYFLIGWSCVYTSNRRRFLLRLYVASVGMSVIQALSSMFSSTLPELNVYPIENNIFATLFQMSLVICLLSTSTWQKRLRNISIYVLIQLVIGISVYFLTNIIYKLPYGEALDYILLRASGTVLDLEGGLFAVTIGVVLWATHDHRLRLSLALVGLAATDLVLSASGVLYSITTALMYRFPDPAQAVVSMNRIWDVMGFSPFNFGQSPITVNYQWMKVFALPFMLVYNHQRGPHVKWFFYVFYPAHIVVLFLIGTVMNNLVAG
ncbi:TraX family protein [Bifidobacterium callitrichos]|uniref:TraX protein n=1 Tax=Bifidobacterium callitrichos DSM 23973 TaxID=1437609 RepID=A0A086ZZB5_9BIFI|nr:TraX family protein [Bifidobacterium callitrichos]KFI51865.1 TraX protein [Bifidobacterium callitrichos DSM 23973]